MIITLSVLCFSCRCSIEYFAVLRNTNENDDPAISVTATMNHGRYEYLQVKVTVNRKDSLFVKSFTVNPALANSNFYPEFSHYSMFSYYTGADDYAGYKGMKLGNAYWQDYHGKNFSDLPVANRKTNYGEALISYSAHYRSKKIDFEVFTAEVELTLADRSGNNIVHKKRVELAGKKTCRFSSH